MFSNVRERFREYPDFITAHSVAVASSGKDRAKSEMENCTEKIRTAFLSAIDKDKSINHDVFGADFKEEDFVDFVMDSIILLLMQQKECDTLIAVINRLIYRGLNYRGSF